MAYAFSTINPVIVRSYDLRGAAGRELKLQDAHMLGLAYASDEVGLARLREELAAQLRQSGIEALV